MDAGERIWDKFLSDDDREAAKRWDTRGRWGFGQSPALLLIDVYRGAFGPLSDYDALSAEFDRTGWSHVPPIQRLLAFCRQVKMPIIHVKMLPEHVSGIIGFAWQGRANERTVYEEDPARYELIPEVAPKPGEALIEKSSSSAFFGTPLMPHLTSLHCDTVIICGEATSGCVRATATDARANRLKVILPEECVFGRSEISHAISLFDMNNTVGEVLGLSEVIHYLEVMYATTESVIGDDARVAAH